MTDFNLTSAEVMFTSQLWPPLLILNMALGGVAVACSLIVIALSRRTSLGDGATLIFVRCLCVTDILTGVCAVSKSLLLMNIDILSVDCFLPESLIITAITASVLFLLWLNVDCFLHLNKPENMRLHIAKGNIISGMVVVWNVAFIVGFLPQMGWNAMDHVCLFLFYYDDFYMLMLVFMWVLIVLGCYWMQILTSRLTAKIKSSRHFLTPNSKIYYKYGGLTGTVHVQLCTMCACCLPCIGYVIYCFLRYRSPKNFIWVNRYLPYALTIFTFRSVLCSFLNGYKTSQIRNLMRRVSRSVANSLLKHRFSNYRRRAVRGRKVIRTPNINMPDCWTVHQQFSSSFELSNRPCPVCASDGQMSIDDKDIHNYDRYGFRERNKQVKYPFPIDSSLVNHRSLPSGENTKKIDTNVAHQKIPVRHPRVTRKTRSYSEDFARRRREQFHPTFFMNSPSITNESSKYNYVDHSHIRKRSISPKNVSQSQSKDSETFTQSKSVSSEKEVTSENTSLTKTTSASPAQSSRSVTIRLQSPLTRNAASCPTSISCSPSGRQDVNGAVGQDRRSGTISYFKRWTLRQAMKMRRYSYDGSNDLGQREGYFGSFDESKLILNESGLTEQTSL